MALQMVRKNARLPVPLNSMTIVGTGATYTRDAANQFSISMPTAAATIRLEIPLVHQFPYFLEGGSSTAAVGNLSGFLLRQILLWYSIGSVDLTSHTFTIASEVIAGNAARAAAVAAGGSLTYNTDDGTSAALATVQRANPYKTIVSLTTPLQLTTDLSRANAEWSLGTGASTGTAKIHGVTLLGDFGLYA
jgi:hypothetical protein